MNTSSVSTTMYQMMSAIFCMIVWISTIISAKMVKMPFMDDFSIPAGVLAYPLTFFLNALVTELFGPKKAKQMVYIALAMNLLNFGIIELAMILPASSEEEQTAFKAVLGSSGLRIFSSLLAYAAAQIVDIQLYAMIKKWTGPQFLWLRNNGSACVSQIVDTVIIDLVYLHWGLGMGMKEVMPIMIVSYAYKVIFSIASTPLFYVSVFLAIPIKQTRSL